MFFLLFSNTPPISADVLAIILKKLILSNVVMYACVFCCCCCSFSVLHTNNISIYYIHDTITYTILLNISAFKFFYIY